MAMLLDNKYTILPNLRFSLSFDSGVSKIVTVKTGDKVECFYKLNGEKNVITGIEKLTNYGHQCLMNGIIKLRMDGIQSGE